MKRILLYLFITSLITSCTSSLEYLQSGHYDAAIEKSRRKIIRKPKDKEILVLEEAYRRINNQDKERIEFLKKEGHPGNWESIFDIYSGMSSRQEFIRPLLPLHIKSKNRDAVFEILNYDNEIINAKQKAAEYFYARATVSLEKGDKQSARSAYSDLMRVKHYYSNYKDVDALLQKSKAMGMSYVVFKMVNKTPFPLPPDFEEELTKITLAEYNNNWVNYDVKPNPNIKYDYTIMVNMKNIDVSPDLVKEVYFEDKKEVPDGYSYVLDARGNVKKDTSGNDIKTPKYKTIRCRVIETMQNKNATINGSIDFIDNKTGQLIKTDPITAQQFFEHHSAIAIGDLAALQPVNFDKLNYKPIPFPQGGDMVLAAGQTLKGMVKNIICNNTGQFY